MATFVRLCLPGLVLAAFLAGTNSASARGIPLFIQTGYASEEMGPIAPDHQADIAALGTGLKAGYVYQRVACFWINIWTWGGEYALFRDAGSAIEYEPVSQEELATLLGVAAEDIKPPKAYRIPLLFRLLGWVVVLGGAFLALGLVLTVVDQRKLAGLKRDPTYQRAFAQVEKRLGPPEETTRISPKRMKKTIAEGADYLEKHDIPRELAERHLKLFINETYKNADKSAPAGPSEGDIPPEIESPPRRRRPQGPPRE